jgi:hypothetical protein
MQVAAGEQRIQHRGHAADDVEVARQVATAG